jgi:hypothetical protein
MEKYFFIVLTIFISVSCNMGQEEGSASIYQRGLENSPTDVEAPSQSEDDPVDPTHDQNDNNTDNDFGNGSNGDNGSDIDGGGSSRNGGGSDSDIISSACPATLARGANGLYDCELDKLSIINDLNLNFLYCIQTGDITQACAFYNRYCPPGTQASEILESSFRCANRSISNNHYTTKTKCVEK